MDRLDAGRESDASIIARRELHNRAMDLSLKLEKVITEKEMPEVTVKKRDIGTFSRQMEVNLDEEIIIRPVKGENEDKWWQTVNWIVQKSTTNIETGQLPAVTSEEVSQEDIKALGTKLPRTYKPMRETERCFLFKDRDGNMVGWAAMDDEGIRDGHLAFVTVAQGTEGKGYGTSILTDLQKKYDSISLSPMPYDYGERKGVDLTKRLFTFYARSGFVYDDSGFFWARSLPNLETLKKGETMRVSERMIASGVSIFTSNLLDAYLTELIREGSLDRVLTKEEAEWARELIDVRKKYKQVAQYN